jgi:poly-beta-1,6-N-acetyl-D-glucosamine synthase
MTTFEIIGLTVLVVFAFTAAIQLFFYLVIYSRFASYKSNSNKSVNTPVSIVVCARNEGENLEKYLPLVLEQDYPDFEVIVVNDCSADDTEDILKRLTAKYSKLRTTFIKEDEKFRHGKKLALTVGIKSAKNEWMLLTDADCFPESNLWLAEMAKNFTENSSIVLGYGGYSSKKSFLNMLIRFDTAIIALNYFSLALFGTPYMGVGRNLAYRKSIFFANKGFASHARLDSGDDDLFINEVSTSSNVQIESCKNAHTRSEPKVTFNDWIEQKKRHFSTFGRYKIIHRILLGGEVFSRIIFYFSFICLLILQTYWIAAVSIFFVRFVSQLITYKISFDRLNERKLFLISPLFDIVFPFINAGVYISNKIRPRKQWR